MPDETLIGIPRTMIEDKGVPKLIGDTNGHGDGMLFRFRDGTEVIATGAGMLTDDSPWWAELRAKIIDY